MKPTLRREARTRQGAPGASLAIQRRLIAQDWWAAAFQAGIYRATAAEPGTDLLLADLLGRGARVAVPMRRGPEYVLGWVDADTHWVAGPHGIQEPKYAARALPEELRVIVVPGLAFDSRGGRLGHGRGHFDRLLARSHALLVGLCFENRLVAEVPMEPHDVRMDMVATEKQMLFAPAAAEKLAGLTG